MSRVNGFQLHYTTTLQHHLMVLRSVLRSPVFHRCNHIRHVTGSTELLTQMKDNEISPVTFQPYNKRKFTIVVQLKRKHEVA
ncbi:uncharacterized protein ACN2A1_000530 isoform 5-T6 [Glossina fuscipes fuscipes]